MSASWPVFADNISRVVTGQVSTTDTELTLSGSADGLPDIDAGEHAHIAIRYALKPGAAAPDTAEEKQLQRWELRKVTARAGVILTIDAQPVGQFYPAGLSREAWNGTVKLDVVATFVISARDLAIATGRWRDICIDADGGSQIEGIGLLEGARLTATESFSGPYMSVGGINLGGWDGSDLTGPQDSGAILRRDADTDAPSVTDAEKRLIAFRSEIASELHQVPGNELVVPLETAPTDYVPIGGEQGDALWVADAGGGSASVVAGHADHLEDVLDFGSDGTTFQIRAGSPQATGWDSVSVTWRASLKGGFEEVVFPLPGGKTLADLREALTLSLRTVSTFDSTGVIVSDRLFLYNEPRTVLSELRPTDADASPDPSELPIGTLWRRAASGLETAVFVKQADSTWRRRRTPMHIFEIPKRSHRPNGITVWADMDDHFDDFNHTDHDQWQMIYQTDQNDGRVYASAGSDLGSISTTLAIEDTRDNNADYGCRLEIEETGVRYTQTISGGHNEQIGFRIIFLPRNDED